VALVALLGTLVLGMERPALFLAAILVVRPLLDSSSDQKMHLGVGAVNLGGALGLCILMVAFGHMLIARRIVLPASTRNFAAVLALSAVGAVQASAQFGSSAATSALTEMIRLAAIFAVFVFAANVASSPAAVRRLFLVVAVSAAIPAIAAIMELATGNGAPTPGLLIERAFSTFSGPNPLGEYCALSALILIGAPAGFMRRGPRLALLALVVGALVITYSRAGYGMLLIGIVAMEYRRLSQRMVWLVIALALVLIAVPSVRNRVLPTGTTAAPEERFAKTGETGLLAGNGTYGSLGWRLHNWSGLLGKWEEDPIVGYGLQTTVLVNPLHQGYVEGKLQGFLAHSSAVRALVEGGVAMLVVWALFCVSLIRRCGKARDDPWELAPYARILWAAWIAIVLTGISSDDPFTGTALMYGCFALTGALQASYGRRRRAIAPTASDMPAIS
jgi:hypothetical protein